MGPICFCHVAYTSWPRKEILHCEWEECVSMGTVIIILAALVLVVSLLAGTRGQSPCRRVVSLLVAVCLERILGIPPAPAVAAGG